MYACLHLCVWEVSVIKCYVSPHLLRFRNPYTCCLQEQLLLPGMELLWPFIWDVWKLCMMETLITFFTALWVT